ncbi:hypothetical protein RHMOL_Rhmol08G0148100 [Rhododendron molle]|uniref:Uncharacterized protein n=1 Tax=Rhododendron molle TaxID=49168 RepID=A0ACC0MQJ6_RHOML|nr:hypothetical protein RHMOL_Rhmol08G0148100 [Rhododendron molle]
MIHTLTYYLSEHPSIVNFRWSHTQSYGSTWSFLFTSISLYLFLSLSLHLLLSLLPCTEHVPLSPIPAIHSLSMSLLSATIFAGTLLSAAAAEIRDTRWLFTRRTKNPRSSGSSASPSAPAPRAASSSGPMSSTSLAFSPRSPSSSSSSSSLSLSPPEPWWGK